MRPILSLLALTLILCLTPLLPMPSVGSAQPPAKTLVTSPSPAPTPATPVGEARPVVWYRIDARLKTDDAGHPSLIEGREELTWLNDSPDTVSDLRFHLYLNAFKNQKSTFFRESGGSLRGERFEAGEWGWIDILGMKRVGGEDLTGKIEYIHPDDDNSDDQTVVRVPLAQPVRPGEKITLAIGFRSRLPRVYARTGYFGTFAMVGQWFPKIGVWESAGERRREVAGWNCHQFHANSEFYADYGVYDVDVTVPAVYRGRIGGTGVMRSEKENADGTLTYSFHQDNVHDFAWTVDTKYKVVRRRFEAAREVSYPETVELMRRLDLSGEQLKLKDVEVTLLIQPEHEAQIDRHFAATFNAIKYFGLWYGACPYQTLTVVDPPHNAEGAGGMEYPTLITAGTSLVAGLDQNPEAVIVHEFGHQYWYGLVGTNEFEESWLDEGFNTWSTSKVLEVAYGDDRLPFRLIGRPLFYLPIRMPHPHENRLGALRGAFNDPILTPTWKYYDDMSYGINSYFRTGLVLATLERYLGEDTFARVMRAYHQQWRYRHPSSADFFDHVNRTTGNDLGWFFDQFVRGVETLDYEVLATSEPIAAPLGIFDRDGQRVNIEEGAAPETPGFHTVVNVRRAGEAWFPVDLRITFADGTRITGDARGVVNGAIQYRFEDSRDGRTWTDQWPIGQRWKRLELTTPSKMALAEVDPWHKVLLDANQTNNTATSDSGLGAATRWALGAGYWVQVLLQLFVTI